jgi:tRNA-specific 2-thiouridylase
MNKRIIVGMSGGVDSSVAAALLQQQGYDVIGATLILAPDEKAAARATRSAETVCRRLGIPWHAVERGDLFLERVVRPFCAEYARGRTPNPCVVCNRRVKFPVLVETARSLGADLIATGHYARVTMEHGRVVLRRGLDEKKDQSYYLFGLDPAILPSLVMPIGEMHKAKVRRLASELGLDVHERPESQDACFVSDEHYGDLLGRYAGAQPGPGPIYDVQGNRLGEHKGIQFYTIGQRRGLGLSAPRPLYVVEIDAARNALVLGPGERLAAAGLTAWAPSWMSIDRPTDPFEAVVKIRYNHAGTMARVTPLDDNVLRVDFCEPVHAITPGQACVFYDGDVVLGGAWIEAPTAR